MILYCISVWGTSSPTVLQELDALHARAAKLVYGIKEKMSVENTLMQVILLHIHAMHAGDKFGTLVARLGSQVCQGQLGLPSFQDKSMSMGNLRLARGGLLGLTKGLKLGSYRSELGGCYGGTLATVVTAVLKVVVRVCHGAYIVAHVFKHLAPKFVSRRPA